MNKNLIHMSNKSFPCKINNCGKIFRSSNQLINHINRHLRLKPYICTECDAQFIQYNQIQAHKLRHLNQNTEEYKDKKVSFENNEELNNILTTNDNSPTTLEGINLNDKKRRTIVVINNININATLNFSYYNHLFYLYNDQLMKNHYNKNNLNDK